MCGSLRISYTISPYSPKRSLFVNLEDLELAILVVDGLFVLAFSFGSMDYNNCLSYPFLIVGFGNINLYDDFNAIYFQIIISIIIKIVIGKKILFYHITLLQPTLSV
jgi:hypothetical protein